MDKMTKFYNSQLPRAGENKWGIIRIAPNSKLTINNGFLDVGSNVGGGISLVDVKGSGTGAMSIGMSQKGATALIHPFISSTGLFNFNRIQIGDSAASNHDGGIAIGNGSETSGNNSVALGVDTNAALRSVALGEGSKSTISREYITPNGTTAGSSTSAVDTVSVGSGLSFNTDNRRVRRIINAAPGINPNDVVVVKQLSDSISSMPRNVRHIGNNNTYALDLVNDQQYIVLPTDSVMENLINRKDLYWGEVDGNSGSIGGYITFGLYGTTSRTGNIIAVIKVPSTTISTSAYSGVMQAWGWLAKRTGGDRDKTGSENHVHDVPDLLNDIRNGRLNKRITSDSYCKNEQIIITGRMYSGNYYLIVHVSNKNGSYRSTMAGKFEFALVTD